MEINHEELKKLAIVMKDENFVFDKAWHLGISGNYIVGLKDVVIGRAKDDWSGRWYVLASRRVIHPDGTRDSNLHLIYSGSKFKVELKHRNSDFIYVADTEILNFFHEYWVESEPEQRDKRRAIIAAWNLALSLPEDNS